MKRFLPRAFVLLVATTALAPIAIVAPIVAVSRPDKASLGRAPDFTGTWTAYPSRAQGTMADPKLIAPPPSALVLRAEYAAPYEARRAAQAESDRRGEPLANASTQCIPNGMPQMMFPIYPIEILQNKGQLTVIAEAFSQVRRIYIDRPQARIEDVPPLYFGHSVGHWEGSTLVVDTVGVKKDVLGYRDMPHSDQMHIEERLHLVAPDLLHDDVTIVDPIALEKPWTFSFAYQRSRGYAMQEYVCENNREFVDDKGVTRMKLQER